MEQRKTHFITFILCMRKITLKNIPDDCIRIIYLYSRPRINCKMCVQIKCGANAKLSIQRMTELHEIWCDNINWDFVGPDTIFWSEFLKRTMPIRERIVTYKNLAFCQCCDRHYGTKIREDLFGKPIWKGKKSNDPPLGMVDGWDLTKFKREPIDGNWKNNDSICCSCPCRHYRRSIPLT